MYHIGQTETYCQQLGQIKQIATNIGQTETHYHKAMTNRS